MSKLAVGALWLCVLLLVVSGTLLSTAAGIPKFVVISSETTGPHDGNATGLGYSDYSSAYSSHINVGAFSSTYYDGQFTFYSTIDDSCQVDWEGFTDGFFHQSSSACQQFKACRSLLIVAIVFDFLLAFTLYSCLLLGRWPSSGSASASCSPAVAVVGYVGLALCCLVPVAAHVTSLALMVHLVFESFVGDAEYGVSFKLLAAAFPLCVIAIATIATHCAYHAVRGNTGKRVDGTATEGVAMEVIKTPPTTAVTSTREDSSGSNIV